MRICYFRGRELGYSDITFEWPYNVIMYKKIKYECPTSISLPIKCIEYGTSNKEDYDKVLDLTDDNVFYDGCKSIYKNGLRDHIDMFNYSNKYYIEHNEKPVFDITTPKIKELEGIDKYILMHYRNLFDSMWRNMSVRIFYRIYRMLKNVYKDYKIVICGEIEYINRDVGIHIPYLNDINDFIKLMNNASLYVGSATGPNTFAIGLGIPFLQIESPIYPPGNSYQYSEENWKSWGGSYGNTMIDWAHNNRVKVIMKNERFTKKDVIKFADEWL